MNLLNLKLRVCPKTTFIYELIESLICQIKHESDGHITSCLQVFMKKKCDDLNNALLIKLVISKLYPLFVNLCQCYPVKKFCMST